MTHRLRPKYKAAHRPILVVGDIAYVPLTKGQVAKIDADKASIASEWNWCLVQAKDKKTPYAMTRQKVGGTTINIGLHNLVMGEPPEDGLRPDHKDGDGLNNLSSNLRWASNRQNAQNRSRRSDNSSGYKGVYWRKDKSLWQASIRVNGKLVHLGYHETALAAYEAYCSAATEHFGEFARLA